MDCKLADSRLSGEFHHVDASRERSERKTEGHPLDLKLLGPPQNGAVPVTWSTQQVDSNGKTAVQEYISTFDLRELKLTSQVSETRGSVARRSFSPNLQFFIEPIKTDIERSSGFQSIFLDVEIVAVGDIQNRNELGKYTIGTRSANLQPGQRLPPIDSEKFTMLFVSTAWSNDSRFLFIGGREIIKSTSQESNRPYSKWKLKLFDCEKLEIIDISDLGLPDTQLAVHPWMDDKFLVHRHQASESSKGIEAWIVDPVEMKATAVKLFEGFQSVQIFRNAGPWTIFRGQKEGENSDATLPESFQYKFYRAKLLSSGKVVTDPNPIVAQEFDQVSFSSDGQFASIVPAPGDVLLRKKKISQTFDSDLVTLTIKAWDGEQEGGKTIFESEVSHEQIIQWHSIASVATWITRVNGYESIAIFDAETNQYSTSEKRDIDSISSNDTGWIYALKNKLVATDFHGEILGQIVFDPLLDDQQPVKPWLILADGSVGNQGSEEGLFFAYTKNDRVFGTSLKAFRADQQNPRLPVAKTNPFDTNQNRDSEAAQGIGTD